VKKITHQTLGQIGLLLFLFSGTFMASAFAAGLPPLGQATLAMRAGMRLSYLQASATVGASGIRLVPDANGNWVNVYSGQVLSENSGGGGAGISLFDVYAFDTTGAVRQAIVQRTDFLINTAVNALTYTGGGVIVGDPTTNIDSLWQNPTKLNTQPDVEQAGLRVKRINYVLDGRSFNAIRIQANIGNDVNPSWVQRTYDLTTGLLLIQSQATQAANGTSLGIIRLTSGRAIALPGKGSVWPTALRKIKSYAWNLISNTSVGGNPFPTTQATVYWNSLAWTPRLLGFTAKINTQTAGSHQYIAGTVGSPWMSPAYLAKLSQNKVLDTEPELKYRVQVGQIANGFVAIYQIFQTAWYGFQYNLSTGELVAMSSNVQEGLKITASSMSLISRQ
jgi:hypothetical protein